MKSVVIAICCLSVACTVSIRLIPTAHRYVSHQPSVKKHPARNNGVLVDSEWLSNYKELEREHGDYSIDDDKKIKAEGAKFRVPRAVINHYEDLVRTKETPSP